MVTLSHVLKARRFHNLMPHRVREILLVSSPYDAFILEEDGQLTERVFHEYREASLGSPPRVTHASTGEAAIQLLEEQRYDLVVVMRSVLDMGVEEFGREVKTLRPGKPVVFLALDARELEEDSRYVDSDVLDGTFLWSGSVEILVAIVKYVEDWQNADHDVENGDVRVIIMIEDSPRFYSSYLGMLYKELMRQAQALYAEGVNELHRRLLMRSRPKILHATNFEKGCELLRRYQRNVMAVITDVGVPRDGELDGRAGLDFARLALGHDPDLPVLIQSGESENVVQAQKLGATFVNKSSVTLLAEIRGFLRDRLGFGDFVFRLPDGTELDRAVDLKELEQKLPTVAGAAIIHHATHNHFSIWLNARSEFATADRLRPKKISDFPTVDALRQYLIEALRESYRVSQLGTVSDWSRPHFDQDLLVRIGQGSMGGKARGIAFLNRVLVQADSSDLQGLTVAIPKTVVIATEHFDRFLDENDLRELALASRDDAELTRLFVQGNLPEDLVPELEFLVDHMKGPLAVRSSSLLEDSVHHQVAGLYSTLMIPNQGEDRGLRLEILCDTIKRIYASLFLQTTKRQLALSGSRVEEEKMALIVQQLVGQQHGERFYPMLSGVAQSFNFYPVGPQRAEDGVVHLALGLARDIVAEGYAMRFSPRHPLVRPQLATEKSLFSATQRQFYALHLLWSATGPDADPGVAILQHDLGCAEEDGVLPVVGSVYSPDDQRLRENFALSGPRVVTFNNILKHRIMPLAETLRRVLKMAELGLGGPVEIEFACPTAPGPGAPPPVLYLLQVRHYSAGSVARELARVRFGRDDCLCESSRCLGDGLYEGIGDLVYVRRDTWDPRHTMEIAEELGEVNRGLVDARRPYVLMGPGRWGTADRWLGIPVKWPQISAARVIVEASPSGYDVEPSHGTHFFQKITSLRVGYVTLPAGAEKEDDGSEEYVDWRWLDAFPAQRETEFVRHLQFQQPLTVVLIGGEGRGVITKPGVLPMAEDRDLLRQAVEQTGVHKIVGPPDLMG